MNKKTFIKILGFLQMFAIVAALVTGFLACGAAKKHPADIIAPVIQTARSLYEGTEDTLLALHSVCQSQGENCPAPFNRIVTDWNKIDAANDLVNEQFNKVDEVWIAIAATQTPEEISDFQTQLQNLHTLILKLLDFVPTSKETSQIRFSIEQMGRDVKTIENHFPKK